MFQEGLSGGHKPDSRYFDITEDGQPTVRMQPDVSRTCFLVQALKAPLIILAPCIRYGAGCLFALCKPTEEEMQMLLRE